MKFIVEIVLVTVASSLVAAEFSETIESFAKELYQTTIDDNPGNIIISPLSIQTASALLLLGATGETEAQLRAGLKFEHLTKQQISENFKNLTKQIESDHNFELANKIYLSAELNLKSSYQELAVTSFNSETDKIDFRDKENAARSINNWVEEKTHGKIPKIIKSGDLQANTKLILVNAVHFKGDWVTQFNIMKTLYNANFKLNENEIAKVNLMRSSRQEVKFKEFATFKVIELPYKHSDLSLLVLLPYKISGLLELEKKLNELDFNDISANLQLNEIDISLPKFQIEFEMDLRNSFEKMAIKKMFGKQAEFDEIIESGDKFKVSKAIHKAVIDVNEVGTEAAASTEFQLEILSAVPSFDATHPFMFVLKTKNYPVFIGRYVGP